MRRVLAASLAGGLIMLGSAATAVADAPLCTLAPDLVRQASQSQSTFGAAVYDLRTGTIWSSGASGPFALHSAVKAPIAWAVLSESYERERPLSAGQRRALFDMVAWSQNTEVEGLLKLIGGLSGLKRYYERWGIDDLATLVDDTRWGRGRATPSQLARLYGALAISDATPPLVRAEGFELLHAVVERQRWGATIPAGALPGWTALIKTGNYSLPPLTSDDPQSQRVAEPSEDSEAAADQEPEASPDAQRRLVRMNSAAIWLGPPWRGAPPRYVVAILQEGFLSWSESRELQNRIGEALAEGIVRRESGTWSQPAAHCLKRALS